MFSLLKKFQEWRNRKPKAVRLAEEVFKLLPDEDWASMKFTPDEEDVRDWVMDLAKDSKCIYTMEKSMEIVKRKMEIIKRIDKDVVRIDVYEMFIRDLYKNPGNYRTLASYFK